MGSMGDGNVRVGDGMDGGDRVTHSMGITCPTCFSPILHVATL